ncbi:quinol dehydrogenase ferredoxin subunit NapH [Helicobacter enhydrae]|uniref:Quinol dehydrogenase ferredoxin subunit NapH n=1 Tax=Helicobacter enhydrae TaxID=222136 RepID=A0A1B1U4M2_9HELI|nr:quinol dehydrogenase ferredoxin subunit NapH [Helicobacter enhydrae]ANV97645.1 quinol dehydrogenase ferredoxin subunit NapH [Helicobacter enhydrae]
MRAYRFLFARRLIQIGILLLFVFGNYAVLDIRKHQEVYQMRLLNTADADVNGVILHKENLSSLLSGDLSFAYVLGKIPLSEPFATLQLVVAGGGLALDVWLGVFVVVLFYGLVGGRLYCAYVCPVNLITDCANFLRRKLGWQGLKMLNLKRWFKYGVLLLSLLLSFVFGVGAFEMINPVSSLSRGLVFGMGFGLLSVAMIFVFDLCVLKNGFCGYICPIGASFGLIGKFSILRVSHQVNHCTKCKKCVEICPEPQVLDLVGKRSGVVDAMACIKCGRCIEVCQDEALEFKILGGRNEY